MPSSMVRNTTGSVVGIRENTGAFGVLMSIGTGVGFAAAAVVVVGATVVDGEVVLVGPEVEAGAAWMRGAASSTSCAGATTIADAVNPAAHNRNAIAPTTRR